MKSACEIFIDSLECQPTLYTNRCLLRKVMEQDFYSIFAIAGNWEVSRRLARVPYPYTEENARFFLDEIAPDELVWSIIDRASKTMIGVIGLSPCDQGMDAIELGYYIDPAHWRRGMATEAGAVVAAYGAGLVGQRRLRSGYFEDNPASGRVLEKLGFVKMGVSQRSCLATGEVKTSIEVGYPDR